MSFPGQLLQLQVIERLSSTNEVLSFLWIGNNADVELDKRWRLYFSLGIAPIETEKRVSRTIIDGRYGYLEPTNSWDALGCGCSVEIPIRNWLFTHMPNIGRQGFHLLSWLNSDDEGSLTLPESLPPRLLEINSAPNTSILELSPSCDVTPDSAKYRFGVNAAAYKNTKLAIIPRPETLVTTGERFKFRGFEFKNNELKKVLNRNSKDGGLPIKVNHISGLEGYALNVTNKKVDIRSGSNESTYQAAQTLRQLIDDRGLLQPCEVTDASDFNHRGLLIDIARHFQSVEDLKRVILAMAAYKMNRMQLGISNDEGWRLEIPGLEELTEVGARRKYSHNSIDKGYALNPSWGDGPEENYAFIPRDEFVDLLRFADNHHVEIVIEFNLPAHSNALIRSIEASGRYQIVDPNDNSKHVSAQGYQDNIVNVCLPDTYILAKIVLSAIAACYNAAGLRLKRIHMGGDELPEGAWLDSSVCHSSPIWNSSWDLKNEEDRETATLTLKKYYSQRIIDTVHSIDPKIAIGFWHEMSDALPNDTTVYITGWATETGDVDQILERQQKLVIANASFLYLDMPYSLHTEEPGLPWAAYISTQRIHDFDAFGCWHIKDANNVLGLQAQLWTETVLDRNGLDYHLFPRLLAVADRAWRKEPGNWADFASALGHRELAYLEEIKVAYRIPPPGVKIEGNRMKANLSYPGLTIRYNVNGENPSPNCPILAGELDLTGVKEIRLATFSLSGERSSRVEIIENLPHAC